MSPSNWLISVIVIVLWLGTLRWLTCVQTGQRETSANPGETGSTRRREAIVLGAITLLFLAATAVGGIIQDYFHYLQMWREIRLGHDPWFVVNGVFGTYPLNAYGPLFNPLAVFAWIHPLFPKLIFATAYASFAIWLSVIANRAEGLSRFKRLLILGWFWNPYVWVEVAYFGHFDVLVGLLCVFALEARSRQWDVASGAWLGLGVLLKYSPIVLLPFLAIDGRRLRWRLVAAAVGMILLGLGVSVLIWGPSTFSPLFFAAKRDAHHLSIYRFLTGIHSPFPDRGVALFVESWAPVILFLALLRTWSWYWERRVETATAAVIAAFVTVLFYQVGFSQYPMVPFILVSWWLVRDCQSAVRRPFVWLSLGAYFGWLSIFDLIQWRVEIDYFGMQEWVGLPTFTLGCLVVAALVHAAPRREQPNEGPLTSPPTDSVSTGDH